jgi:hypothetical protein
VAGFQVETYNFHQPNLAQGDLPHEQGYFSHFPFARYGVCTSELGSQGGGATPQGSRHDGGCLSPLSLPILIPGTFNVIAETITKRITTKTKAVMPVHQMGLPFDLDPAVAFCKEKGLLLIEHAALAIGSEYKGKKIGGHGNISHFIFHPRKIITTGEGGMITTDDPDIAEKLRRFWRHGMSVLDVESVGQTGSSSKRIR